MESFAELISEGRRGFYEGRTDDTWLKSCSSVLPKINVGVSADDGRWMEVVPMVSELSLKVV